jgi:hypothetical protein
MPAGGAEHLTLDPSIEAEMRRLELERLLQETLEPKTVRKALADVDLKLVEPPPSLAKDAEIPATGDDPVVPAKAVPETPREADGGDVLEAIAAVPAVDHALTILKTDAGSRISRDWGALSGPEKALVVTSGVSIAGGALGGALVHADSRDFLLQQLHGRDIPVPGVDGLSVTFSTQKENLGVMFNLDVGRLLPASAGFR